ncbi:MAG: gliding motility lipoprotein GldD [Bacteroidia bacterium]|nr:gliding motility lipoprotein GldD [Bacteroidia bacterium]
MKTLYLFLVSTLLLLISCNQDYIPKPAGYFRIDLPEKKYQVYDKDCPYTFEYPLYSQAHVSDQTNALPCWLNLNFPDFKAKIHLSYIKVTSDLNEAIEECRTLVYKHDIKADAIKEVPYSDSINKVYGTLYEIKGNAASSIQFYVTDSLNNLVRGALYFEVKPNKDSLAPVINFLEEDITHIVETIRWK